MGRFNEINLHNKKKEKIVKELTLMIDNIFYNKEDNEKNEFIFCVILFYSLY